MSEQPERPALRLKFVLHLNLGRNGHVLTRQVEVEQPDGTWKAAPIFISTRTEKQKRVAYIAKCGDAEFDALGKPVEAIYQWIAEQLDALDGIAGQAQG